MIDVAFNNWIAQMTPEAVIGLMGFMVAGIILFFFIDLYIDW
jgi:hypothetical protein